VAATVAAATIMRCRPPLMARRLIGRSHRRRLSVRGDGALRVGPWRLRLYGVAPLDGMLMAVFLRQAIAGRPVHLRVLRIERGVLVVVLRCDGVDLAASLLRQGLAMTRGSGAIASSSAWPRPSGAARGGCSMRRRLAICGPTACHWR
jgi:hypothetical protein